MEGNPVSIRCDACGARFRFDRALIAGYQGARFRCRRCGHPIVVSVPVEPSTPQERVFSGFRANPREPLSFPNADPPPAVGREPVAMRSVRSAPMAVSVAEELPAVEPMSDNLVDLLRFRESYRLRPISDTMDISGRIRTEIPIAVPRRAEIVAEVPATDVPASRMTKDSLTRWQPGILEEEFLWRVPEPREQSNVYLAVKMTLFFTLTGAAAVYLGFNLFLALVSWAIG